MELELLEAPLAAPLWTEDEMNFVAALLSDAPDVPLSPQSSSDVAEVANPVAKKSLTKRQSKKHLTPEEKAAARRVSHRETMRRSRQRFRDQIAAMVSTVQELEKVKEQALRHQQHPESELQGQVAHLVTQKAQLLREHDALHAQLVDSLLAITKAHPNNFEHDKVQPLVNGVKNGYQTGQDYYAMHAEKDHVKRDPITLCDFVTWDVSTIGHCLQLIRDATSEIARFYAIAAKEHTGNNDMMGWRQLRRKLVKENMSVEFAFDKVFRSQSASRMFEKTWQFCRDQTAFASLLEPVVHALQLEVLHCVNDDIVVVRRMQQDLSPLGEKQTPLKYRSIYLLYRMTTPAGLFVVLQSVNPSFTRRCGCANNLWFESFLWFGFSATSGEEGCRVRFGGSLDGHSEDFARRWQQEIFFMLLRWESHNVAPFVLVQPTDEA